MKKSCIIILAAFVLAANLFAVQIFAGSDVVVAIIEAEEGKSLDSLEAGDVVTVSISLPELDDVTEFALDLSDFRPRTFIRWRAKAARFRLSDSAHRHPNRLAFHRAAERLPLRLR